MKRNLFVTSNRLGDAVLTTGILHHLIKQEPDIPVTVICGTIPADIFAAIPQVERVITLRKEKYNRHWIKAAIKAGPHFWNRIVDYRGSIFSIMPARHRHIWTGGDDTVHKTVANARLIGVDHAIPPLIIPSAADLAKTALLLKLETDKRPVLALAPTANFDQKQWHHENFLNLAKTLTGEKGILNGARIAILGAPGEEKQAMPVVEGLPSDQIINLVGKTTPLEAACYLSHASLFVGNDSGLMHSAVAVGVPTVGLFGIGKPVVYGPSGKHTLLIKGIPEGQPIHLPPCGDNDVLPLSRVSREIEAFFNSLGQ
ncbi:glycosyltransferase family 9 protein [Sneathiella aquimaris]|uniref:glycosyltransferase family 9 protein n=1 Tax=Sneathiella aquimaris TaxID=2599305 RepID=UPI00146ECA83|nr:glycosyltransferase family 9 protein [Sneathiella aquimaris]